MKKIEDIELWLVHRAHERVGDSLYFILNQRLSRNVTVFQGLL